MDEQKNLMRDLLFSSANMAAMTSRENLLYSYHNDYKYDNNFEWLVRGRYHQQTFFIDVNLMFF